MAVRMTLTGKMLKHKKAAKRSFSALLLLVRNGFGSVPSTHLISPSFSMPHPSLVVPPSISPTEKGERCKGGNFRIQRPQLFPFSRAVRPDLSQIYPCRFNSPLRKREHILGVFEGNQRGETNIFGRLNLLCRH